MTRSAKEWNDKNTLVMEEFRANAGIVVGQGYRGMPLLILTTTGAKSGQPREIPLCYVPDGEGYVLIASKGGSPTHPDWYHNLVANPEVTLEVGLEKFQAIATLPRGTERRRLYDAMAVEMPFFAEYERTTTQREIPVVLLKRVTNTE